MYYVTTNKGLLCIGFNHEFWAAGRQLLVTKTNEEHYKAQNIPDTDTDMHGWFLLNGKPTVWNMIAVSSIKLSPC